MNPRAIELSVNGEKMQGLAEPRLHLGDFLREQQRLTGTHLGCEHGVCGACTVLIDGQPARSCIAYAVACEDREVRTIEGFPDDPVMTQLRAAFNREHALQCGFCTPGMLITARDVVLRVPEADEARVRVEMSGNICRCTGYRGIVRAVLSVIEARRAANSESPSSAIPATAAEFRSFTPDASGTGSAPATASAGSAAQGTVIEESFTVDHPAAAVWTIFGDVPTVAACLPGAEITEHSPTSLKGRIRTKLGPMEASFAGSAVLERDDASRRGAIRGNGTDSLSGSRARGDIRYQVSEAGAGRTNVSLSIDYALQGPLAQFSRGGLVKAFVAKMVSDFAANLDAKLAGSALPVTEVSAGGTFWNWLRSVLRALFGGQ